MGDSLHVFSRKKKICKFLLLQKPFHWFSIFRGPICLLKAEGPFCPTKTYKVFYMDKIFYWLSLCGEDLLPAFSIQIIPFPGILYTEKTFCRSSLCEDIFHEFSTRRRSFTGFLYGGDLLLVFPIRWRHFASLLYMKKTFSRNTLYVKGFLQIF